MKPRTLSAIAHDREDAAEALQVAFEATGEVYRRFAALTKELSAASGKDFSQGLDAPISLQMSKAGLGAFLERKLSGEPGHLRDAVARQQFKLLK